MAAASRQLVLDDELPPAPDPVYLHANDPPATKPTYLYAALLFAPAPSRQRSNGHGPPGEQVTLEEVVNEFGEILELERERARERQSKAGGAEPGKQNFAEAETGQSRDAAAEKINASVSGNGDGHAADVRSPTSAAERRVRENLPDTAEWVPSNSFAMPNTCDNCGGWVSARFKEVNGDEFGFLDGCRACKPRSARWGDDPYGRDDEQIGEHYNPPQS